MTAPTGEDRMLAALAARGASPPELERARARLQAWRERRRAREAPPDALPVFVARVHGPALLRRARREADRRWAAEQYVREIDGATTEALAQITAWPGSEDGR